MMGKVKAWMMAIEEALGFHNFEVGAAYRYVIKEYPHTRLEDVEIVRNRYETEEDQT
jgi:hypothetical protein|tara:strand:- start:2702 stop:2872 length:171 start_codon:yes stop_codon:yes gene_type:complete